MVDEGYYSEIIELGYARCEDLHHKPIFHLEALYQAYG